MLLSAERIWQQELVCQDPPHSHTHSHRERLFCSQRHHPTRVPRCPHIHTAIGRGSARSGITQPIPGTVSTLTALSSTPGVETPTLQNNKPLFFLSRLASLRAPRATGCGGGALSAERVPAAPQPRAAPEPPQRAAPRERPLTTPASLSHSPARRGLPGPAAPAAPRAAPAASRRCGRPARLGRCLCPGRGRQRRRQPLPDSRRLPHGNNRKGAGLTPDGEGTARRNGNRGGGRRERAGGTGCAGRTRARPAPLAALMSLTPPCPAHCSASGPVLTLFPLGPPGFFTMSCHWHRVALRESGVLLKQRPAKRMPVQIRSRREITL